VLAQPAGGTTSAGIRPRKTIGSTTSSATSEAERASRAIYEAVLETVAAGIKTPDLGGHAGTTEFTTEVVGRVATKLDVWSSLGSAG